MKGYKVIIMAAVVAICSANNDVVSAIEFNVLEQADSWVDMAIVIPVFESFTAIQIEANIFNLAVDIDACEYNVSSVLAVEFSQGELFVLMASSDLGMPLTPIENGDICFARVRFSILEENWSLLNVDIIAIESGAEGQFAYNIANDDVENEELNEKPQTLSVYPNPGKSSVNISYSGKRGVSVELEIYSVSGRRVGQFSNLRADNSGLLTLVWDGNNGNGKSLSSGVYFVRARVGENEVLEKKVILIR